MEFEEKISIIIVIQLGLLIGLTFGLLALVSGIDKLQEKIEWMEIQACKEVGGTLIDNRNEILYCERNNLPITTHRLGGKNPYEITTGLINLDQFPKQTNNLSINLTTPSGQNHLPEPIK